MQLSFKQGILLVLVASVMWGVSGVIGQFLFQNYHTDALWLITVRQLLAGLLFLSYLTLKKKNIWAILQNRSDLKELLLFTFGGLLGAQYGFYYTISLANAATATILQYSAPVLVVLYLAWHERRCPEPREILGVLLAIIGVFLISTHGRLDQLVISPLALFWGLLSAVSLAVYTVCPTTILRKYTALEVMGWGQMLSGLFLTLFCNPFNYGSGWDLPSIASMTYIIVIGTIVAFTLFLMAIPIIGPTKASLISCAEPLSSILCVVLVLGTPLSTLDIIGMLCIIVTVLLLSLPKK